MRQAQRKKEKDKIAVALMLAFCVIALTSVFTIKSNIDKINESAAGNLPVSEQTPADQPKQPSVQSPEKSADNAKDSEASVQVPVVDSADNSPQSGSSGQPAQSNDALRSGAF